jgi:hypothetical protein
MWAFYMVILVVALLLIAASFFDFSKLKQRLSKNKEPDYVAQAKEAAFAVIEASLQAEPEKWENNPPSLWLVNKAAGLALEVYPASIGPVLMGCNFRSWDGYGTPNQSWQPPKK